MRPRILILAALLLSLAPSARAAVGYGGDAKFFSGTPSSTLITVFTPGAGTNRILFVSARYNGAMGSVPSAAFGGSAMVLTLTTIAATGSQDSSYLFYLVNPAAGPANVTVTVASQFNPITCTVWTMNGVDQVTPINKVADAKTTGLSIALNFTLGNAANTFMALTDNNVGGGTAATGYSVNNGTAHFSNSGGSINSNKHSFGIGSYAPGSLAATNITQNWAAGSTGQTILAQGVELNAAIVNTPTTTPTPSISPTFSDSPTPSPSVTDSPTVTISPTVTPTSTSTSTASPTSTSTPAMPLSKSVNVAAADLGDTVTYSFNYFNDSGTATDIHIWDTLPVGLGFVGCDNACVQNGSVVSWTISAVPAGTGGTVQFWAVVNGYPLIRWLKQQWAILRLHPATATDCGTGRS